MKFFRCSRALSILRCIVSSSRDGFERSGARQKQAVRPKFYALTAAGRTQLERELESWSRLSSAINLVVEGA